MTEKKSRFGVLGTGGLILFFFTIIVAELGWISYKSIDGVFGTLSFVLLSVIGFIPWIIPFVGIPLGILEKISIFDIYPIILNLSGITPTLFTITWYSIIVITSSTLGIFISVLIVLNGIKRRYKIRRPDYNIAIINCNIIDGKKESSIIKDGVILIKNIVEEDETPGLIEKVGDHQTIEIPNEYKKIDLEGHFILPGLINAHCHLTGSGKPMRLMGMSDKWMEKLVKFLDTLIGKIILKRMMRSNAINALNAGVTTLVTMSDPLFYDLEIRDEIEEGKFLGPRIICSGKGICITGGHGGVMAHIADSKVEIRKAVRKNLREKVDFIKILSTGGVMDARAIGEAGRPQMTVEEIKTACFEAHRGNLLVATHCESTRGIEEALEGGVDSIEHGAEIPDEFVPKFKNNPNSLRGYTILTPTLSAGMGLATLPLEETKITKEKFENAKIIAEEMIKGLRKAYDSDIELNLGTDASVPYSTHYEVWKEIKYWIHYIEMNPQEAIYHATLGNAENYRIDNITGSISEGKFADLQVVADNPLEKIDSLGDVTMVIMKGIPIVKPKLRKIKHMREIKPIKI
ncbi:MAG: amidohydrolase family protein [Promethearchaeota archaeon]|nr:MAG: amidohydrolase family protein [Candidatus Lokiarchaeota archaeon]